MPSPKFLTDRVVAQSLITDTRKEVAADPDNADAIIQNVLIENLKVAPEHLRAKLLFNFAIGLLAALTLGETKDVLAEFGQ